MPDLTLAVQDAVFDKLSAAPAVTSLGAVHQHVPDQAEPPLHVISGISATPAGAKDGGLDRIEIEIHAVSRKAGREFVTAMMAAQRAALEDQALTPPAGVELSRPVFESSDDTLLDDGITYVGVQRFSLFAQPA